MLCGIGSGIGVSRRVSPRVPCLEVSTPGSIYLHSRMRLSQYGHLNSGSQPSKGGSKQQRPSHLASLPSSSFRLDMMPERFIIANPRVDSGRWQVTSANSNMSNAHSSMWANMRRTCTWTQVWHISGRSHTHYLHPDTGVAYQWRIVTHRSRGIVTHLCTGVW